MLFFCWVLHPVSSPQPYPFVALLSCEHFALRIYYRPIVLPSYHSFGLLFYSFVLLCYRHVALSLYHSIVLSFNFLSSNLSYIVYRRQNWEGSFCTLSFSNLMPSLWSIGGLPPPFDRGRGYPEWYSFMCYSYTPPWCIF